MSKCFLQHCFRSKLAFSKRTTYWRGCSNVSQRAGSSDEALPRGDQTIRALSPSVVDILVNLYSTGHLEMATDQRDQADEDMPLQYISCPCSLPICLSGITRGSQKGPPVDRGTCVPKFCHSFSLLSFLTSLTPRLQVKMLVEAQKTPPLRSHAVSYKSLQSS